MDANSFVANGFFFALDVMGSLGIKFDSEGTQFSADDVMQRLREVANGEVSVYGSPGEELAAAEEDRGGQPATPEELTYFQSAFADRKGHDKRNQEMATQILKVTDDDTPMPPPPRGPMMV